MLTMCSVFLVIINLCKIARDNKHCLITETIHTNLTSRVCSVTQATQFENHIHYVCNWIISDVTMVS